MDYEDSYAYYKGHIERIVFDFRLYSIKEENMGWYNHKTSVDLGLGKDLTILPNKDGHYYTLTVVEQKVYELGENTRHFSGEMNRHWRRCT